jgi:cell division protein ZapB
MKAKNVSTTEELNSLETKIDVLINEYKHIKVENISLKTKQDTLVREKTKLLEKTTLARTQVEAMINRLKAMEQSS